MKYNITVNPTRVELKRMARECLYTWDEIKGTITGDSLIVWFDDIHHVDMMNALKIDYNTRYDIVLYFSSNEVVMTKLYDRTYTDQDIQNVRNNKHVRVLMKEFKVRLEDI